MNLFLVASGSGSFSEGRIRKENNLDPHHCSKVSGQVVKMDGEEKGPFLLPFLSFASILTIFSIYVLSFSLFLPGDGEGNIPSKYRLVLLLYYLCFVATIQGVYLAL